MKPDNDIHLAGEAVLLLIGLGLWCGLLVTFLLDCCVVAWRAIKGWQA